jgi:hypothetical protein
MARHNADSLDRASLRFAGVPLGELRASSRRELFNAAEAFLARVEGAPERLPQGKPLVVTGHQPLFFHPGIWIKNLLVQSCVEEEAAGVNLIVDTDDFEEVYVAVPRRNGRLVAARRSLARYPPDVPFEVAAVPTAEEWSRFVASVRADVETLGVGALTQRTDQLASAGERARKVAANLGEFMAVLRRSFERGGQRRPVYWELPVSAMSGTRAFRCFALWILHHHESFRECHNRALNRHREEAGLRSAAQPFPNLRLDEEGCELPFWRVHAGRRWPTSAVRRGATIVLRAHGEDVATVPVTDEEAALEALVGARLRPRALTLTMFARLCWADLFVHGIGGGHYDRATDRLIVDLFEIDPPRFAVASATFHVPLSRHTDPRANRLALERKLLEVRHNPDRFLDEGDDEVRDLVQEKWGRIRELESAPLTRRQRREVTQRIRAINQTLADRLQNEIRAIEEELRAVAIEETEHEIATFRAYPFFLFDPDPLRAALRIGCAALPA